MNWKDKNYIQKGRIIGGVVGFTGSFFAFIFSSLNISVVPLIKLILLPFMISSLLFVLTSTFGIIKCPFKTESCYTSQILGYIFTIIIFILLGALIGWIVGKNKSR